MTKEKPAEVVGSLLTIGDEILLGDIANGNAHHIASELRARGFRLDRMFTVGDCEDEIIEVLSLCLDRCDFLIVTGGLGPTDDDRTCSAVSKAFDRPLHLSESYSKWLKERLQKHGISWSSHVARLAELPEGATKMALEMAGFFLEHRKTPCYFLPGVPHEMKELLQRIVIPDLETRFPKRLVYVKHILRTQGISETEINRRLVGMDCIGLGTEIGYYPQVGENWVTLFVAAENGEDAQRRIQEAEKEVISRVGAEHISGYNDDSLEKVVGQQLRKLGWKLAAAESCTGGLLSRKITSVPGASDYFDRAFITYSNRAKTDLLGVPQDLLAAHGAVSEPVARAMADGARAAAGVDVSIAITGIAGPAGGTGAKPVGTVFIACATPQRSVIERHLFQGDREHIQESAAQAALVLLWRMLSE